MLRRIGVGAYNWEKVDVALSGITLRATSVIQGYVSMTPLRLDLTNESELSVDRERYLLD
jgi:hypothetical protein